MEALRRRVTAHHRFLLSQHLGLIENLERTIEQFDQETGRVVEPFRGVVERIEAMPGIGRVSAQAVVAEIGVQMGQFRTVGHLRVDRIQDARITNRGFTPRFAIELAASGPILAAQASRRGGRAGRVGRSFPGPTYILECGQCGKRFTRSRMDATLRPHKDRSGWPCSGRTGFWADTRY